MPSFIRFALLLVFVTHCLLLTAQDASSEIVIGNRYQMTSKFNNYEYEISVHLPRNYDQADNDKKYPVLYLFIGRDLLFHTASGSVRLLSRNGEIPEMIIVGVTNISWWNDLTPERVEWRDGKTGGAPEFLQFITGQLIPFTEEKFRTTDHRSFMGHSLGGMFGVYALTENKDLFDDYVLLAPSVENRANSLYPKLTEIMSAESGVNNDIYMIVGSEGDRMDRGMHKLATAFATYEGKGLRWKMEENDDYDHFSLILPGIRNGLLFVAANDLKKE